MTRAQALERGRDSFDRRAWGEAYRLLHAAQAAAPLDPEDVERLAAAAYLIGKDEESELSLGRAHQLYLGRADHEGAARSAFWLAFVLLARGSLAPAAGWLARAERVLDEHQVDCVIRGYLLVPAAIRSIVQGDPAAAHATFTVAAEIASRFGDRSLSALASHGRGRALIRLGRIAEGVGLLDEAMVCVLAGDVTPLLAGDVYCSVLEACQETFDLRRAYEWTTSLARWCAAQPDLVRYRGECRIYRAEVLQSRGKWRDAEQDAREACALLTSAGRAAAGAAYYRLGELHRLRGEFDQADSAYTRASEYGRMPQPGLSLLRLAQGQIEVAAASIRSLLADTRARGARARLLAAGVEILLAAADLEGARAAASELAQIAGAIGTPYLEAMAAHAAGAVHLAADDPASAAAALRRAGEAWRDLEMPYEEAQTLMLLSRVCERRGDEDGCRLEREAARRLFAQLDAGARPSPLPGPSDRRQEPAAPLSARELQVLRLLASGKTNRAIAEELFISEKTVARHVSNIFDKLCISSRAGATAWAYQHQLI